MDVDAFATLRRGLRGEGNPPLRDDDRSRLDARHLAVAGTVVLALGVAIVVVTALRPARATDPAALDVPNLTAEAPGSSPATSSAPPTTAARVWPAEPVAITGTEVRTAGHRWQVGEPGDLVAVGDWDCDGTATPAVVRPSTSRLYLFDTWAGLEAVATATPGPTVPAGVTSVEAEGCGRAAVRTADGRTHLVSTATP